MNLVCNIDGPSLQYNKHAHSLKSKLRTLHAPRDVLKTGTGGMSSAQTITAANVRKPLRLDSRFSHWSAMHTVFEQLWDASRHTVPQLEQHLHTNAHLPANAALIE